MQVLLKARLNYISNLDNFVIKQEYLRLMFALSGKPWERRHVCLIGPTSCERQYGKKSTGLIIPQIKMPREKFQLTYRLPRYLVIEKTEI